jgi:hypothetical protein
MRGGQMDRYAHQIIFCDDDPKESERFSPSNQNKKRFVLVP